jgi:hypothetical protein
VLDPRDWADASYSRYYAVIIGYAGGRFHKEKMAKCVRALRTGAADSPAIPGKKYNFRLADERVSDALSGFGHNAVAPIGMAHTIPLVVSHRSVSDALVGGYLWLGGGEVDVKFRISANDLKAKLKPVGVWDITYESDDSAAAAGDSDD